MPAPTPPIRFDSFRKQVDGLSDPGAAAIDRAGRIYIVETSAHRVRVMSPGGDEIARWGALGDAPGELRFPHGIAIAPDGLIYVSDAGNARIQVFDANGQFVRTLGALSPVIGELNHPRGLTIADGYLFVADAGNDRVVVLGLDGSYVNQFAASEQGARHLHRPADVAVDSTGRIFVADCENHRIQSFDSRGSSRASAAWGDWGWQPGMLASPLSVAIFDGRLYVADSMNHRIQLFELDGKPLAQWGRHAVLPHEGNGQIHYPNAFAIAPSGDFAVVCESFEDRIQIFTPSVATATPQPVSPGPNVVPHYALRIAADSKYLAAGMPESQIMEVFDFSQADPVSVSRFGDYGPKLGQFNGFGGLAMDAKKGRLYVGAPGARRLDIFGLKLDPSGELRFDPYMSRLIKSIDLTKAVAGLRPNQRIQADAILPLPEGDVLILDSVNSILVHFFGPDFRTADPVGSWGALNGRFRHPTDIARSKSGELIYVVDSWNNRIQALDSVGGFKFAWGRPGSGNGEFTEPFGIAAGRDGFVYVTDRVAHRVQKFDEQGNFVAGWGSKGVAAGEFFKPAGIAQDQTLRLIVVDDGNHRWQMFSPDGKFQSVFGARLHSQPAKK